MVNKISDYKCYTKGMKKSIKDKLFFEGLISDDVDTFVDFGCADGQILHQISLDFPEWKLIGIDNDAQMAEMAHKLVPDAQIFQCIPSTMKSDHAILNISSVIHEIYSYLSKQKVDSFWKQVFDSGFKYISIRDLMLSISSCGPSDINDVRKIVKKSNNQQLLDFVGTYGDLMSKKNMLHFLMKYRYEENWNRELRENYFPITLEHLLNLIPDHYEIIYFNHYILPFTKEKIKQDFDINIHDNTHVKILLKNKGR